MSGTFNFQFFFHLIMIFSEATLFYLTLFHLRGFGYAALDLRTINYYYLCIDDFCFNMPKISRTKRYSLKYKLFYIWFLHFPLIFPTSRIEHDLWLSSNPEISSILFLLPAEQNASSSGEITSRKIRCGIRVRNLILKARSVYEARVEENGEEGYIRPGFLKFIFCCMYSLSFKFFRLRVVSRALRSFFLARLLILCFISFSRYLWKPSVFASSGPLHLRFVMSVSSSYLRMENLWRCLPRPGFIKYRTLRNIYWTCWLFRLFAGNLERSYCPRSQPIKTSRKLNIMRQIFHLPSSSFGTFKIYYLIFLIFFSLD